MAELLAAHALVFATFLAVAAAPGPANLCLAATAMARGRRAGLALALGLTAGLAVWGLVALAGLSAVLAASPAVMVALKLLGGTYLLWLAVQSGRAALAPDARVAARLAPPGRLGYAWRGLALNLTNPKAVLAWTATLAVGAPADGRASTLALVVAICALIGLANYLAWALVFSLGGMMRLHSRARRGIEAATAALLGAAGIGLIFWRVRPA